MGIIGFSIGGIFGKDAGKNAALYSNSNLQSCKGVGLLVGLIIFIVICIRISEGEAMIGPFALAIPIAAVAFIELLISEHSSAFNLVMSQRIKIHEKERKKKLSKDRKQSLINKLQFWK